MIVQLDQGNWWNPSTDQWFRGPMAPFGGIEWQISDQAWFKAEYSSDAYTLKLSKDYLIAKSQFNFGAEYQVKKWPACGRILSLRL